ncbi:unnamed protein product [Sphenostylis stenocarpa]|uniref:NET domain-containing protein n=1 Tax=Sphenostylis stenocarpa TaxID=92480 RepID=A0AA86V0W6_9FABA|nr:unnamed protein product [Sphenostylis stenocarpa]
MHVCSVLSLCLVEYMLTKVYILTPIYRSMTLAEKQQLQSSIQKLSARNLDRVVELICRNRPVAERSCDKIFVDLETEDNATLWRLHYYVEAVEKAKTLSCGRVD